MQDGDSRLMYLEGNTSQSECLEISMGSLHGTQDESFLTGADVVLPIAMEGTHTEEEKQLLGLPFTHVKIL